MGDATASGRARREATVEDCVHFLFEGQVERTPSNVAVLDSELGLTYRELNGRANALARELRERGIEPNAVVGLYSERTVEMVVGILGILKAGAAYLPLDPSYPAERLGFLVADSGARLVVNATRGETRPPRWDAETVVLPAEGDARNPARIVTGEDLAYVIYTSGSTGLPKGVLLEHRGLASLMRFTLEQMEIDESDRVLQFASFSFDASIWEIFAALLAGATLVLSDRDGLLPGPNLHRLLRERHVTIALLSPSVIRMLEPEGLDELRILVAGTEKLTSDIVRRWAPGRRFFNAYGPTETTIYSTILEVEDLDEEVPSIGSAVPGTEIFILDDRGSPVPAGEPGELAIAGVGVGRGYLSRDALTQEKFVRLSLPDGTSRRIYRTGDRARLRSDGNVDYLGRTDYQVKVRGFRVELPEIEAVLETHEAVGSAAVVDGRDGLGQTVLWAYFVPEPSRSASGEELRRFLVERLPEYMIPSSFTELPSWPLNANGKLDRKALPPPAIGKSEPSDEALTPTERLLADLVGDILEGSAPAREESFAIVGLHSLAIAELVLRIENRLGVRLKYSEVFSAGNLSALASVLEGKTPEPQRERVSASPAARASSIPLSFAQERIWFLERLHPESRNAYQFQALFRMRGPLDVPALEKSLNTIVSRHEILRTSFPVVDERPIQRVHPFEPFVLALEDVSSPEELDRRLSVERSEPFDLTRLPLVRWKLFRHGALEHVLLHREHHFLHDGWSYGVFLEELAACYGAFSNGATPVLDPPSLQYREHALRERERFEARELDPGLEYWKRKLRDAPPPLSLPSDRPRPRTPSYRGGQIRRPLGRELYGKLVDAAGRAGVTPFLWLHALFHVFLYRYTGERDIIVGTGFANRTSPDVERMLGMVINTVPVRVDLSEGPGFDELSRRLRETLLEAFDHQDVPFEAIVRETNPERASGRVLFHTFFDSYDRPFPALEAPGLTVEREDGVGNGSVKFDLVVLVVPASAASGRVDDATILFEYSSDLFHRGTAERMLSHYVALLESSLANPRSSIDRLAMLGEEERSRVLEWSGDRKRSSPGRTLPDLFREQVAIRPEAVAVSGDDETLTYRELDRRAKRVAAALKRRGVGRGDLVGVALERGVGLISCLLGVLQSGAAYLPLDPDTPRERLDFLLRDAGASLLVAAGALAFRRSAVASLRIDELFEVDDEPRFELPHPSDLAYVMYTSGSTGTPKGVLVPHGAVARLVHEPGFVDLGPEETLLSLAPLSFDASAFEIWGALANGARLVLFPPRTPTLAELGRFLERARITTLWLTAPLFHQMVDAELDRLAGVRQIVAGGDVLSAAHVEKLLARLPTGARFVNGYGPTENATFTCCHVLPPSSEIGESVPIGRPIPGTRVYLLDDDLEPVGIGVPGELYAAGEGLARGYGKAPERTAERFVPSPFDPPGERLYRTGDRCRWLEDGTVAFLGRRDRQVKIRGFRVELFEVEQALLHLAGVREALAYVDDGRLAAAVVPDGPGPLDPAAVRRSLAERLPEYLVPSSLRVLDRLPLTASGKLDRSALPSGSEAPSAALVSPRTETEERLAAIWREALGVERLSVVDGFFALGGHSLLATRILGRVEKTFGVELPLSALFEYPTVAELAQILDAGRSERSAAGTETGEL